MVKAAMTRARAPLFALVLGSLSGSASAGEFDGAAAPAADAGSAHCDGRGGLDGLKDSGGCMRISGYIAAGVKFAPEQRPAPFVPLDAPEIVTTVRAGAEPVLGASPAAGRFFMQTDSGDPAR